MVIATGRETKAMSDPRTTELIQDKLGLIERAMDATAEGIAISDASLPGNPVIVVNAGFERLTGYTAQEVVGRNCRFLQGPRSDPHTVRQIRQAIEQGTECTAELLNYRKDGTPDLHSGGHSPRPSDPSWRRAGHAPGGQGFVARRL